MTAFMIAGGGTGGHIFPALALGEALLEKDPQARVVFVGTRYGMEQHIIPQTGRELRYLPMRGLLGKSLWQKLGLIWRLPVSMLLSLIWILKLRPRVLVGVGGYASLPLLITAALMGRPVVIQEQNAFPGLANRLLSRWARVALLGFVEAKDLLRCPSIDTGNPVRGDFYQLPDWQENRRQILILGGSQGASCLNEYTPGALMRQLESRFSVLHQCGRGHREAVLKRYENAAFTVEVVEFIDDLPAVLSQTRCVISRAGASTISELKAARVPAILVPFARATHDHQTHNARSLVSLGAAILIAESQLVEKLDSALALVNDNGRLSDMAASFQGTPDNSSALCAEVILAVARGESLSTYLERADHVSQD
ncbi:MAG: undecaprenyldiphospho-muramoylpentapeptide beta-N-acetylglucosaminyltransferase [Acidobacteria bacterium]|nr:undecaprenyldiphospho-muramoylpentapeptide beta-N-acetylglucosaminyltransferase [Acidobacteriota bacterium]